LEARVQHRHPAQGTCRFTLTHLISGTRNVPGFGDLFMDRIGVAQVEDWQTGIARLIVDGQYAPTTANGWLAILKMIFKSAQRDLGLTRNPVADMRSFDTSEHVTYTEEEPNALTAEEAARFLEAIALGVPPTLRDDVPRLRPGASSLVVATASSAGIERRHALVGRHPPYPPLPHRGSPGHRDEEDCP
jgi:hypothetical protein